MVLLGGGRLGIPLKGCVSVMAGQVNSTKQVNKHLAPDLCTVIATNKTARL